MHLLVAMQDDLPQSYYILSAEASVCWWLPQELQLPVKNIRIFIEVRLLDPPCSVYVHAYQGVTLRHVRSAIHYREANNRLAVQKCFEMHQMVLGAWGQSRTPREAISERYYVFALNPLTPGLGDVYERWVPGLWDGGSYLVRSCCFLISGYFLLWKYLLTQNVIKINNDVKLMVIVWLLLCLILICLHLTTIWHWLRRLKLKLWEKLCVNLWNSLFWHMDKIFVPKI